MAAEVFIYALNDPTTGRTRYVGKAKDPIQRLGVHISSSKKGKVHRECWIRSLTSKGLAPVLEILDSVPEQEWQFWEREYIRLYRALFSDLTNGTLGGDGLVATPEICVKIGNGRRGKLMSAESKERMRAAKLGRKRKPFSIETRAKMSAVKLGKNHPNFGKKLSREHCFNLSVAQQARRIRERSYGCR